METKKTSVKQKYEFKAVVHETDERTFYLKSMLDGTLFPVPTHVFAPNVLVEAKTLTDVDDGATVYCGRILEEAKMLANSRDITLKSYSADEKFQAINSRLTAEGALAILIERLKKSVAESYVFVLGFGRTGAAVTKILCKLDVTTDVATTSSLRPAHAFAKRILPMRDFDFSPYDAVINTVPSAIVSDKQLMSMKKDCVYIDLASTPAINLEYARYLGIDAQIYPALPAKACPVSAAKAMYDYIMENRL